MRFRDRYNGEWFPLSMDFMWVMGLEEAVVLGFLLRFEFESRKYTALS